MTKITANEFAIKILPFLKMKMEQENSDAAKAKSKLEENYLHYFEWYGDTLYQSLYRAEYLRCVIEEVETKPEVSDLILESHISRITKELLKYPTQKSTSPLANLACVYQSESKAFLLDLFEGLKKSFLK